MKTLLGIPLSKIDKLKYLRQLRCIVRWIRNKGVGTVTATTGLVEKL